MKVALPWVMLAAFVSWFFKWDTGVWLFSGLGLTGYLVLVVRVVGRALARRGLSATSARWVRQGKQVEIWKPQICAERMLQQPTWQAAATYWLALKTCKASDKDLPCPLLVWAARLQVPWLRDLLNEVEQSHFSVQGKDIQGRTLVFYLGAYPQQDQHYVIKKAAECSLNARDYQGYTTLHLAVKNRQREFVQTLIACGVDFSSKTPYGESALDLAAKAQAWDIHRILRNAGQMVHIEGLESPQWTPFKILGFSVAPKTWDQVEARYRAMAKERHPDLNLHLQGDQGPMQELNRAYDQLKSYYKIKK